MRAARKATVGRGHEPERGETLPPPAIDFPIVGIGASAGGLDAFKRFFEALPADTGMAFVLIQHLDPTRPSLTAELVGSYTRMPVAQATDGMQVEPNRVYVIPPNAYLAIRKRTLWLSEPTAIRSRRMAVDFFLQSLAVDQGKEAIGIVLSGSGTDGTAGLREIRAIGGSTMVQDPSDAQHDGMPRSAIADGPADYVGSVESMAARLLELRPQVAGPAGAVSARAEQAPDPLATAVELLRKATKVDFRHYRRATLRRRIRRRMDLRHVDEFSAYIDLLRREPAEAIALSKDMLIHVTSFFRDSRAWDVLQKQVVRALVATRDGDSPPLRVWVPACASGEEAYSLAIVLHEEAHAAGKAPCAQVFASDVDADALERARRGVYPESIAEQVSPERLARFFTKCTAGYRVNKELRDSIVFAQHSMVSAPPFSRLDLVSCRNLFIYLEPVLQERLLLLLHFALVDGGFLFLGSAEGIGSQAGRFETISARWRIYRRVGPASHRALAGPLAMPSVLDRSRAKAATPLDRPALPALAQQLLLHRYAPACVIVDRDGQVLYFQGRTDDYLTQPTGVPTRALLALARPGLRVPLRALLREAIRKNGPAVGAGISVRQRSSSKCITVTVEPLEGAKNLIGGAWLVSIEEAPPDPVASAANAAAEARATDTDRVHQLEYELETTQEDLHKTIEDVRAANEELMSMNEEIQSSNEELETSKEELQSLNEELTTANTQLEVKIGELAASTNDLDNLLTSTNIATLFLDSELRIRRFTPATTHLFSLIPSDLGRPIGDIAPKFVDPDLLADVAAVLQRPVAPRSEIQADDGRWYIRQVLPYRVNERTEGVVVTFSDVAAEALQEARRFSDSIVDTVRESLLVLDGELRIRSANRSYYATFQRTPEETIGRCIFDLGRREWDNPELRTLLGTILPEKRVLNDFEVEAVFPSIGTRTMHLNARAIDRAADRASLILLAIEDVTERVRSQMALRESEIRKREAEQLRQRQAELAHAQRISTIGELASGLAHELNQPLGAIANGVEACAGLLRAGNSTSTQLLALLTEASEEALRAASIVEHLRHFIEKGKPQLESLDLLEVARSAVRLLGYQVHEQDIDLQLDLPAKPVRIRADGVQIEQIFVNLIQNAVDALRDAPGERREIQIHVRAAKGQAQVAVRDTGSGLTTAASGRLFAPFFTTKAEGLGMGLSISRSILEAHGGRIWAKDRADGKRGTTIRWNLPLARAPRASRTKETP